MRNYIPKIILPYPPTANLYWRMWRGRMVVSTEARKYRTTVCLLAKKSIPRPLEGPCCVMVTLFRPRRRGDLDNGLKVILDALRGIAYADDEQIVHISATREDDKANPRAELTVWPELEVPF